MTTNVTLLGKTFFLRSAKAGEVDRFPYTSKPDGGHFRYLIYVYNRVAGRSLKFSYFTSVNDYQNRKEINETGLKTAFYNFMGDVLAGDMPYEEFVSEFGYEHGSAVSKKIYNALQKSREKWASLGLGNVGDYYNAFQEAYPDNI